MIPSVDERIGNLSEMRNRVCEKLPINHPLQPQIIPPLNIVSPEMNVETSSSSQPPSTKPTQDTSVLDNLVSHYLGELPEVRPNLQKASEVTSMEVTLESPQHQQPNSEMASPPNEEVFGLEPEQVGSKQLTSDQTSSEDPEPAIPELSMSINIESQTIPEQTSEINMQPSITNSQPLTSRRAIQTCTPTKPHTPSPPSIFLDSVLLADVCENVFQEMNSLIQTREELVHKDDYKKLWKRLKERVDYILTALQKSCIDAQDAAQMKFHDWLKGIDQDLQKVKVLRTWVQTPLCLRERTPTDFLLVGVQFFTYEIRQLLKSSCSILFFLNICEIFNQTIPLNI